MLFKDLIASKKWFATSLLITLLVPGMALFALTQFTEEISQEDALEVAAVAVKNYVDENPPRQGWRATKIYIGQKKNLVVDIHVPRFDHAEVIRTRKERIKYSYLKLACPPQNAWVYDWLNGNDRIWINLHHHGETLLRAPCPGGKSGGFFS